MTLQQIRQRVLTNLNDELGNIFSSTMLNGYINEGIDRLGGEMYFEDMAYLVSDTESPIILPSNWHYLLVLYASSRAMEHDERHYQAVNYMNEFEGRLDALVAAVQNGEVILKDITGEPIEFDFSYEGVTLEYFNAADYSEYEDDLLTLEGLHEVLQQKHAVAESHLPLQHHQLLRRLQQQGRLHGAGGQRIPRHDERGCLQGGRCAADTRRQCAGFFRHHERGEGLCFF